jgi:hypothetical protein
MIWKREALGRVWGASIRKLGAQRDGCDPCGVQGRRADILVGDTAESSPELVGRITQQRRRSTES